MAQTIIRVNRRENPYAQIDKFPLNDAGISFKAKGILAYLLSKPDGWELRTKDLQNHATDGRDAVRSGVRELIDAGYIRMTQERDNETGHWDRVIYTISERPQTDLPQTENPDTGYPDAGEPDTENPSLNNNDSTKNEFTKNDGTNEGKTGADAPQPQQTGFASEILTDEQTTDLDFERWEDVLLRDKLRENVIARAGRDNVRGIRTFQTIQQKQDWRDAIAIIKAVNNGTSRQAVEQLLDKGLSMGRFGRGPLVAWMRSCAQKGGEVFTVGSHKSEATGVDAVDEARRLMGILDEEDVIDVEFTES